MLTVFQRVRNKVCVEFDITSHEIHCKWASKTAEEARKVLFYRLRVLAFEEKEIAKLLGINRGTVHAKILQYCNEKKVPIPKLFSQRCF